MILTTLAVAAGVRSEVPGSARSRPATGPMSGKTNVNYAIRFVQGFDMKVWMSNQMASGLQSHDRDQVPAGLDPRLGLEYPVGSGVEHLYGGGPWLGGIVDGTRKVSEGYNGNTGEKFFRPDPAHPLREVIWRTSVADSLTEPNRRSCDDDGDGRFDEDDLDGLDNDGDWNAAVDDIGADGIPDQDEVSCKGGYDPLANPDPFFDNYDRGAIDHCRPDGAGNYHRKEDPDFYTELNGIPDHGEPHVDEDYAAISDNDFYCSARDDNDVVAVHYPMGVKVIQKSYSWAANFAAAILPIDYIFINESDKVIRDVYVGYFNDMDVGPTTVSNYYARNYSCYIDSLYTAFVHNPVDRGATPLGLTVLGTPKRLDSLRFVFQWCNFTTRSCPDSQDSLLYSWMSGEYFGVDYIAPCESPGNPTGTRFLISFGPFEFFNPGDTLKISMAFVSGDAVAEGPNNFIQNCQTAIRLYRSGNRTPVIPPSPDLRLTEGFQRVSLEWGPYSSRINPLETWDDSSKMAEGFPPDHWRRANAPCSPPYSSECTGGHQCDSLGLLKGGRIFEGFRLYRSEDPGEDPESGSFTLVREYDFTDDNFNYNTGIDSIYVDSNLVRGKRYWYAVTSFSIPQLTVTERRVEGGLVYDSVWSPGSESSLRENMVKVDLSFSASDRPDEVLVVPNPYRVDMDYTYESGGWEGRGREWDESRRLVKFIHLPRKCTIRVFSLTGDLITTLPYEAPPDKPDMGELEWNLLSESNRALASGIYVYTVESDLGRQVGKFVLVR